MAAIVLLLFVLPARAEPEKIDQLIVRMWPGPWGDAFEEVGKAFTRKTGIPVAYDRRVDGVMSTLVQAALAQGRQPPVDVFYTFDLDATKMASMGLLDPVTPAEVPALADMLPLAKPALPGDAWPFVNVGLDIVTLVYRADKFPAGPPDSYKVMFDPAFKGRIFLFTTSEFMVALVARTNGWRIPEDMDKIWTFMEDKVKPMEAIIGGDPELVGGFQRDELDVALSYPTIANQLAPFGVKWTRPKEGLISGDEAIAIPRGLPPARRYWAAQFIQTLLSADVLQPYCDRLKIPCLRKGMTIPPEEMSDPAFPKTPEELAQVYTVPLDVFAAHQSEWNARYDEIIK